MSATLESTPVIHADDITRQKYIGPVEFEKPDGEFDYWEIVLISTPHGRFLVAGGNCNAGLIPEFAMEIEDGTSTDETLQEICAGLQDLDCPSGALLAWHGSMVI